MSVLDLVTRKSEALQEAARIARANADALKLIAEEAWFAFDEAEAAAIDAEDAVTDRDEVANGDVSLEEFFDMRNVAEHDPFSFGQHQRADTRQTSEPGSRPTQTREGIIIPPSGVRGSGHQVKRTVDTRERRRLAQRDYRRRSGHGCIVVPVEIDDRVVDILIASRWLAEGDASDRRKVATAIAAMLAEAASRR